MSVHAPIPLATLEGISSEVVTFPLVLVNANPGEGATEVATALRPTFRIAHIHADPTVAPAPYFTLTVEVDLGAGYAPAYTTGGGFVAPWNGAASAVAYHTPTSPYVFAEVVLDYAPGALPHDTTISVRITGTATLIGWGHFSWGHMPWGHVTGTSTALVVEYDFATADETAPRLLSAVATDRETVRVTFDDAMRLVTPDGRAQLTTGTAEGAWGALPVPGTLTVAVDGAATVTASVLADMLSTVYPPTALDLARILPALIAGLTAEADVAGTLTIHTALAGDTASLQVTGGTWNATLLFPTALVTGNDTAAADASNYTFLRNNVYPAVAVHLTPTSAAVVAGSGDTQFDLTVQWPMTPSAPYAVAVAGDVTDSAGNPVDPSYLTAAFAGFLPARPAGRVTRFPIPERAYEVDDTGELRAFVNALEEVWNLQLDDIDALVDVWDPDRADTARLALHLTDQGDPFATWAGLDLTEAQRRRLLRALPTLYQFRGTDVGIEAAIRTLLEIECDVQSTMLEVWTLGVSLLGDYYPAQVVAANPETYNLGGGPTDLWVVVDDGHAVLAASPGGGTFTLAGLLAAEFTAGYQWRVYGSTANDGMYTTVGAVETGDETVVTVVEAIPSAIGDGTAIQAMQFSAVPGVDFVNPAAATADEVAIAIAAQIYGGAAAALNPGGGTTVAVASSNPGGTIQVVGGSANVALAFDTARISATGGCVLGPGTARLRKTFDLVVSSLPTAADQALMRRIANWAKPVNTHLGRIRTAYVVADDGIWRLGRSRLGADTVLG
jgi:phage tail-like protein